MALWMRLGSITIILKQNNRIKRGVNLLVRLRNKFVSGCDYHHDPEAKQEDKECCEPGEQSTVSKEYFDHG